MFGIAVMLGMLLVGMPSRAGAVSASGMALTGESLQQPYSWQDPCCFGVDDFLSWTAAGQLAPGASYTYVPRWPISSASEAPEVSASVRWSGATTLRLSTVVPANSTLSGVDPRVDHVGQPIVAPLVGSTAALCMFLDPAAWGSTVNYAITVTNVGSVTATGVSLSGQAANGYTANYGQFCNHADADGDGWNDTLEQGMYDLTYPAVSTAADQQGVLGTDYLSARSSTAAADDEVDSYPPDVNDDGVVDAADVARIEGWVGQGTGVPLARVDYSNTDANTFGRQFGLWRRYDLNGDGWVTAADVAWVQAEVGRPVPDPIDVLAPVVALDRAAVPATVRRKSSVFVGADARDNRALVSVRFAVNGTALTQQCSDPMTEMADPTLRRSPAQPAYQCVWNVPAKAGTVTLTVTATDAAGNTSRDSMSVTVS
jgi:hypothetical protein